MMMVAQRRDLILTLYDCFSDSCFYSNEILVGLQCRWARRVDHSLDQSPMTKYKPLDHVESQTCCLDEVKPNANSCFSKE